MKTTLFAAACAAVLSMTSAAWAGDVIQGATGKYMSPFTSDGVTAAWVTKSMQVRATGQVGAMAGQYAAQKALESIPFAGMLGKKAGEEVGRQMALKAIGGEEFLKSTSDLSFATAQDLADYVKANYADHPDVQKVIGATVAIYPDVQMAWSLARRPLPLGTPMKGVGPAPATYDHYKIAGLKAGQVLTFTIECEKMEPMASLSTAYNTAAFAGGGAKKGEKVLTFDATIPNDGDYTLIVTPMQRMFGAGPGGGAYTVTVAEKKL